VYAAFGRLSNFRSDGDVEHLFSVCADAGALIQAVANDPQNAGVVADQRDTISLVYWYFRVHQDVLYFLPAAETNGVEPVTRASRADYEPRLRQLAVKVSLESRRPRWRVGTGDKFAAD
jgi:hypothetical protein